MPLTGREEPLVSPSDDSPLEVPSDAEIAEEAARDEEGVAEAIVLAPELDSGESVPESDPPAEAHVLTADEDAGPSATEAGLADEIEVAVTEKEEPQMAGFAIAPPAARANEPDLEQSGRPPERSSSSDEYLIAIKRPTAENFPILSWFSAMTGTRPAKHQEGLAPLPRSQSLTDPNQRLILKLRHWVTSFWQRSRSRSPALPDNATRDELIRLRKNLADMQKNLDRLIAGGSR